MKELNERPHHKIFSARRLTLLGSAAVLGSAIVLFLLPGSSSSSLTLSSGVGAFAAIADKNTSGFAAKIRRSANSTRPMKIAIETSLFMRRNLATAIPLVALRNRFTQLRQLHRLGSECIYLRLGLLEI